MPVGSKCAMVQRTNRSHVLARISLAGAGLGALTAVVAEPGFVRGEQLFCATELTESDSTTGKAFRALGQGADGRAIAAIEAGRDINGAVAFDLSKQLRSDDGSVQCGLLHLR